MNPSVTRPSPVARKPLNSRLLALAIAVAILASVTAAAGLLIHDGGQPYSFTTVHGETVELYGRGLYQNDTFFKAPILRGTDLLTLFVAVPLLVIALLWYSRDWSRGQVFLLGVLSGFFLFVWLIPIIESIAQQTVPHGVAGYTIEITYFIDLGIIAPAAFIAAWLTLRRRTNCVRRCISRDKPHCGLTGDHANPRNTESPTSITPLLD